MNREDNVASLGSRVAGFVRGGCNIGRRQELAARLSLTGGGRGHAVLRYAWKLSCPKFTYLMYVHLKMYSR